MMQDVNKRREQELVVVPQPPNLAAIGGSLLLHLLLLWLFCLPFSSQKNSVTLPTAEPVQVQLVDPRELNGQIVDLNDLAESEPPDQSSFLSDKNRGALQEMQAAMTGVPRRGLGKGEHKPQTKEGSDSNWEKNGVRGPVLNTELPRDFIAGLTPVAPSNYLPNIAMGDTTLLNTREYAYAHFFIRMKRQLELVWNPRRILDKRGGPSRPEYRTVLAIILNSDGTVARVQVVSSSSMDGLDQEAVRAVYAAAPYLNPPNGLLDRSGRVNIQDWYFIVTSNAQTF